MNVVGRLPAVAGVFPVCSGVTEGRGGESLMWCDVYVCACVCGSLTGMERG
jgi:hypothetical protein